MKEDIFKKRKEETGTAKKEYTKFLDKAMGPAISITIHLVLIAILSFIVFYRPVPAPPKFSIIEMGKIKIPEMKTELSSNEETTQSSDSAAEQVSTSSSVNSSLQVSSTSPPGNIFESSQTSSFSAFDGGFMSLGDSMVASGIGNGNPFGHRKGGGRGRSSKRDKKVRKALSEALKWLKNNQNGDGSWGKGFNPDIRNAVSSLAVLAFLAHGETTSSPEFGVNVRMGLKNLLKKSGGYSGKGFKNSFGEALLTYVLAEGATVTQVPELLKQTRMRTILICRKLEQENSWRTGSSSAWNYQALKAAVFATPNEGFNKVAIKSAKNLLSQNRTQSSRAFSKRGKIKNISELDDIFARSYCLQLFGYTKHPNVRKNLSLASRANRGKILKCDWEKPPHWPLYSWYYRTNALFFASKGRGRDWKRWYKNFTDVLLAQQNDDGSFYSPESSSRISKDGETTKTFSAEQDLMVYSTAMCALMMQTKYRYLPSYCSKPKERKSSQFVFYRSDLEKKIGVTEIFEKFDVKP